MNRRIAFGPVGTLLLASCAASPPPPPETPPVLAAPPAPVPAAHAEDAAPPERTTPDAEFRKTQPAAGPEPTFKVPAVTRFKLKNGLEVTLAESHDLPIADFNLIIKTGANANPKGKAGLADLTANMLDEGTKTRRALQIVEQIEQLGGNIGTGAGADTSNVTLACLSKNIDQALAIWADVLMNPTFDEKEFTRVRDNLLTSIARRKDSPATLAGLTFTRAVFGDAHPYAWPGSGVEETVKKLTVADLKGFWDAYYRPNNAALVVAGDITEADLKAKLEAALKDWKPKKSAAPKVPAAPAIAKTKVVLIDKAGAPQSSIRVGRVGLERTNKDYIQALVTNLILGGSFMRLDMNLRESKGWTYGARSNFDARRAPGAFSAGGEFKAEPDNHTADAVGEILSEMKKMRDADVTDDELRRAKDQVIKAFPARFGTRGGIAGSMAELAIFGLPVDYWDTYTKKIEAVTKADVRKMAQKYFTPDKVVIAVVGDQAKNQEALAKFGPVEIRDLDSNPTKPPAKPTAAAVTK